MLVSVDAKICTLCKESKSLDSFWKNRTSKDGLAYRCSACMYANQRDYGDRQNGWSLAYYHRDKAAKPEKYLWKQAKARAKKRNLPFDLEVTDIKLPELCPYFNRPFKYNDPKWSYSIDRIVPARGYVKDNIEVVSCQANRMKWDSTEEEMLEFAKGVLRRNNVS